MANNISEVPSIYILSEIGYRGPRFQRVKKLLGSRIGATPPSRQESVLGNLAITVSMVNFESGDIYRISARDTTKPGSPKSRVAVLRTKGNDTEASLEDISPTALSPTDFAQSILYRKLQEWKTPSLPEGFTVRKSLNPLASVESLSNFMKGTRYWSGEQMQWVTPDVLVMDSAIEQQLTEFTSLETVFLQNVIQQYADDVKRNDDSELVSFLEGNLKGAPLMNVLRSWVNCAPPNQPPINYFRPDMGLYADQSGQPRLTSYEINIETAGTPAAVLYRLANRPAFSQLGLTPFAKGSDRFIPEVFSGMQQEPVLAITGVTPGKPSQALYEKGQEDLAEILSKEGLPSACARLTDLQIKDDRLFLPSIDSPVSLVFWRIQPFRLDTLRELTSPQGELLKQLYAQRDVTIFPAPFLPFLDNKNLEALVWNDKFSKFVPKGLRNYVPQTEQLTSDSRFGREARMDKAAKNKYIIKRAIGAGGGVVIGLETKQQDFLSYLDEETTDPPRSVIQEFKPPITLPFRTVDESEKMRDGNFYLRIEPTIICANDGPKIADLLFTGRSDTRLVSGNKKSIMGTVGVTKL